MCVIVASSGRGFQYSGGIKPYGTVRGNDEVVAPEIRGVRGHEGRGAPSLDGVRVVAVTTGIGMTTGLGLGEAVVTQLLGNSKGNS